MMPRCVDMPDWIPTADAIMKLFVSDDVVLRASEIMRRTGRNEDTVRKSLWRLARDKKLFRIGLCQYARNPTAKPIQKMRSERMAAIERRLEEVEAKLAAMEAHWANRGPA